MNNDERDKKLNKIYDVCIRIEPVVSEHHITLYDEKTGHSKRLILLEERQNQCPARKAGTIETKRTNIAMIMMVVMIISTIANIVLALVK